MTAKPNDGAGNGEAIAILLKGYPRLSETFIAQEIRALEKRGFRLRLYSMRYPTDTKRHPIHSEIEAPVVYLPEYLYQAPLRVFRAWRRLRRTPLYRTAFRLWLKDLWRDFTPNRGRRFGQALVLAAELPDDVRHIHAHFLHTPASVARYGSVLSLRPWSVSAHAKDIWTSPDWELSEKLADCSWAATCTQDGATRLQALAVQGGVPADVVNLVYHGLDLARFPAAAPHGRADGRNAANPVALLTVCRAVEKKGLDDLLAALARLPADVHWRLTHVGGGPLLGELQEQAVRLGIDDRIVWRGALAQADVIAAYQAADLFVLPSKIAEDGDRDGLPNVLMEAASQALPALASDAAGIPEFIEDGVSGRMTPPGAPEALATALAELIGKPDWRLSLGRGAEALVRGRFSSADGADRMAALLAEGEPHPQPQPQNKAAA